MVTYNTERYVARALDSIIEQRHNYPYEIIIGDDYSTDGTRDILLQYKNKYPDIIILIFNENNLGMIKNYFNVLSHCSGKYIMACADDYWLPDRVEQQIQYMEMHPETGMVYGKIQHWYEKENIFVGNIGYRTTTVSELMRGNGISAQAFCVRNDLVKKYVIEIDPVSKDWKYEDYPMWFWLAFNSNIHFQEIEQAIYRIVEGSISNPINRKKMIDLYYNIIDIRKFYANLYKIPLYIDDLNNEIFNIVLTYLRTKKNLVYDDYIFFIKYCNLAKKTSHYVFKEMANKSCIMFRLTFFFLSIYDRYVKSIKLYCLKPKDI